MLRGRFLAGLLGGAAEAIRGAVPSIPRSLLPAAAPRGLPPLVGRAGGPSPSPSPAAPGATTAMIDPLLCLAHRGTTCTVCVERCPEPGAIRVLAGGRGPLVDPRACTGCRVCHDVCPAPSNAVRLLPRMPRPPAPPARGLA